MQEKSIEKDEEILNNIKAYMQENIDKGYHKFVYNDLGYDEKCVDVINAIEHILSDYKRVLKENKYMHNELDKQQTTINKYTKENEYYKECLEVVSKHLDNIDYDQILFAIYEYYISKQKVKDKIEELNKAYEDSKDENGESEYYYPDYTIRVLEELLESE